MTGGGVGCAAQHWLPTLKEAIAEGQPGPFSQQQVALPVKNVAMEYDNTGTAAIMARLQVSPLPGTTSSIVVVKWRLSTSKRAIMGKPSSVTRLSVGFSGTPMKRSFAAVTNTANAASSTPLARCVGCATW